MPLVNTKVMLVKELVLTALLVKLLPRGVMKPVIVIFLGVTLAMVAQAVLNVDPVTILWERLMTNV